MEARANQPIADIVATAVMETYPQTPGRAGGVFEFLTERRKQQEPRPLPQTPASNSRPSSFSASPESSPQEDSSLEPSQYVRVSQELSSISKVSEFNGDESSVFDPSTSPTPIVGNPQIPQRIDARRAKTSFDDRLLRNIARIDQENCGPFTTIPAREHRSKSTYMDADKAFIVSPDLARSFGDNLVNGRSPVPFHHKVLSAYENQESQENDWSLRE